MRSNMAKKEEDTAKEYKILKPTGREFIKMGFQLVKKEGELTSLQRGGIEITKLPPQTDFTEVLDIVQGWLEVVRETHIKSGDWDADWKPYLARMGLLVLKR